MTLLPQRVQFECHHRSRAGLKSDIWYGFGGPSSILALELDPLGTSPEEFISAVELFGPSSAAVSGLGFKALGFRGLSLPGPKKYVSSWLKTSKQSLKRP